MSLSPQRPRRTPVATYRLQFHRGFTFRDATDAVPYLASLGITDCYSSPYLTARPGSTHGYDICNHNELNPELGSPADYETFTGALQACDMGQVFDFVPNHMGIDPVTNPWWRDVLENGQSSAYARFFDIDWQPVKDELQGKVLLPILGAQYGNVLERGELQLVYETGALVLRYFDSILPIYSRSALRVYRHDLDTLRTDLGEPANGGSGDDRPPAAHTETAVNADLIEFLSILTELQNLPHRSERHPERIAERQREKEVARARLDRLTSASPRIRRHIDDAIRAFNGTPGEPHSFDLLHDLLEDQAYRLAYWRTAAHEINYRRFFDINDLAGLRMEDPAVFDATHGLVERLVAEGKITGLRLDHPDGLFDPAAYFSRVQNLVNRALRLDNAEANGELERPLYLAIEKILSAAETLPSHWPIHGTTGYNFLNDVGGLFVSQENSRQLRRVYTRFTSHTKPFGEVVYESKKQIMETALASELNVLAHALNRLSEQDRRSRDFTLNSLRDVLVEVVACFPVYRTYVSSTGWTSSDRQTIETAVRRARRRNPAIEQTIFDFVREALLPRQPDGDPDHFPDAERRTGYGSLDEQEYRSRLDFSMRLQQYTGPVQAKGLEDTAFYRYNLLISLNEVGGDPGRVGRSLEEFHHANQVRLASEPLEMTTTGTHDSKLGEDVRARVSVLSELPDEWRRELGRWARINAANRTLVDGEPAPDRNEEYRFYQTLLGAWPPTLTAPPGDRSEGGLVDRFTGYMVKAAKEAKVHTSWVTDNKAYDEAIRVFVEKTLTGPTASRFVSAFLPYQQRVARIGMINSLAQVTLKISSPGVPDFYQGSELWDLNLVDPDNRKPVDFALRARMLAELSEVIGNVEVPDARRREPAVRDLLANWADGAIKMFVATCALRWRRAHAELFLSGKYIPLQTEMAVPAGMVAFARKSPDEAVLVVTPRLVASVTSAGRSLPLGAETWGTSKIFLPDALANRSYRNLFTGEELQTTEHPNGCWLTAADVFKTFPIAMLIPAS